MDAFPHSATTDATRRAADPLALLRRLKEDDTFPPPDNWSEDGQRDVARRPTTTFATLRAASRPTTRSKPTGSTA